MVVMDATSGEHSAPGARRLGLITGSSVTPSQLFDLGPVDVEVTGADGSPVSVTGFGDERLVVLPRHGISGHRPPHAVDDLANIRALLAMGVDRVVALGSSGSLRSDWPVGTFVLPDDVFAPWCNPIWIDDERAHFGPRFDAQWRGTVRDAWRASSGVDLVDGGVYVQTHGPRFESAAEIRFYATVADLVGMTLADEALLAQQAELPYAAICPLDNMANGIEAEPLSYDRFAAGVQDNVGAVVEAVRGLVEVLAPRA